MAYTQLVSNIREIYIKLLNLYSCLYIFIDGTERRPYFRRVSLSCELWFIITNRKLKKLTSAYQQSCRRFRLSRKKLCNKATISVAVFVYFLNLVIYHCSQVIKAYHKHIVQHFVMIILCFLKTM